MIAPLLETLWPTDWLPDPGWLEIRCIRDGKVDQSFHHLSYSWRAHAAGFASGMSATGWDVYFGVLPRIRQGGTNADVVTTTPFLWADVDAKKAHAELAPGKALALEAINAFSTPPSIIVDSGGGYHCYWLLSRPEPLDRAQDVMRWIAKELRGDNVHDAARVLRVPGTLNHKREEPTKARLLRLGDLRYRLADLEGQIPVELDSERPRVQRVRVDELPDWLGDLIRDGAPQGSRSEACFRAMVWLLRYGRTPEEIRQIFEDAPAGIGAKLAEKTVFDGARWFGITLAAAERVA